MVFARVGLRVASAALAVPPSAPALLDLDTLPEYLVGRHLVDPYDIVHGGFRAEDRSRRNRSFKVRVGRGQSLLVKQADTLMDAATARTVRVEAEVLRAIAEEDALSRLRWLAPAFVDADAPRGVCVTELVDPATTLTRYHQAGRRRPVFDPDAGRAAAMILATVHERGGQALAGGLLPSVPRGPHYMLTYAAKLRPHAGDASPAIRELTRHVREHATWTREADAILRLWEGKKDLVHGDARWENFLLGTGEPEARMPLDMRLIDWELALVGDGAFDVATWFAEYFRFWAVVARPQRLVDLADLEARSTIAPRRWHDQARAFWHAYARRRGLEGRAKRAALARAICYLPPLLVIVATEACKAQVDYPGSSRALVELSQRVHDDPVRAASSLLGIRLTKEAG